MTGTNYMANTSSPQVPMIFDGGSNAPTTTELTTFTFEDKFTLRGFLRDGEPWFVAADACMALSIGNTTQALARLDADEQALISIEGLSRGNDVANMVNESGLYSLILGSRKPEAKKFKKWVTSEVLPSIRKTGSYSMGHPAQPPVALPDFTNPAAAARAWAEQFEAKAQAQEQLAIAAPKAAFVDQYVECTGLKGFREVAKLLGAKEPEFRAFLQCRGVMYRLGGEWTAYSHHIDAGRFVVKAGASRTTGHAYNRSLFTPKGVEWIAGEWAKHQLREVAA